MFNSKKHNHFRSKSLDVIEESETFIVTLIDDHLYIDDPILDNDVSWATILQYCFSRCVVYVIAAYFNIISRRQGDY